MTAHHQGSKLMPSHALPEEALLIPMPDELAAGFEGRRMLALGCASRPEHLYELQRLAAKMGRDVSAMPRLHLLANSSAMSTEDFSRGHSMLAALRVTARRNQAMNHGSDDAESFSRRLGMLTQRPGAYLCAACVREDINAHGFSWFRRSHHLVGVDVCHVHRVGLYAVNAPDPFDALPMHWLQQGNCKEIPIGKDEVLQASDFVRRFTEISMTLMDRERPLDCAALHLGISNKAKELGLRVSSTGQRSLISDRVVDLAHANWLKVHVPGIANKKRARAFSRIDSVGMSHTVPVAGDIYPLVLAALFSTSEQALRFLSEVEDSGVATEHRVRNHRGDGFWQGEVWMHYLEARGHHVEIARRLGMDRSHVSIRLNALGLPSLHRIDSDPIWKALAAFADGESPRDACEQVAIEPEALYQLIRTCLSRVTTVARSVSAREDEPSRQDGVLESAGSSTRLTVLRRHGNPAQSSANQSHVPRLRRA